MTPEQAEAVALAAHAQLYPDAPEPEDIFSPWVITAIRNAHEFGRQHGEAAAQAEHRLLAENIESKYAEREANVIRSTCAALIEAIHDDMPDGTPDGTRPEKPYVVVDIDRQLTIWDRWTLTHMLQDEDKRVLMTLERRQ